MNTDEDEDDDFGWGDDDQDESDSSPNTETGADGEKSAQQQQQPQESRRVPPEAVLGESAGTEGATVAAEGGSGGGVVKTLASAAAAAEIARLTEALRLSEMKREALESHVGGAEAATEVARSVSAVGVPMEVEEEVSELAQKSTGERDSAFAKVKSGEEVADGLVVVVVGQTLSRLDAQRAAFFYVEEVLNFDDVGFVFPSTIRAASSSLCCSIGCRGFGCYVCVPAKY